MYTKIYLFLLRQIFISKSINLPNNYCIMQNEYILEKKKKISTLKISLYIIISIINIPYMNVLRITCFIQIKKKYISK